MAKWARPTVGSVMLLRVVRLGGPEPLTAKLAGLVKPMTAKISLPPLLDCAFEYEVSNLTVICSVGFQSALNPAARSLVGRLKVRLT